MIRRWHVEPDIEVDTADGPVLAVSMDAIIQAAADACVMCNRAGGGFSMQFGRYPTGLPGEMVTTGAIVEWRDRTDAKEAPERQTGGAQRAQEMSEPDALARYAENASQPERQLVAEPPAEDDVLTAAQAKALAAEERARHDDPTQYRDGEFVGDDIGDGLDPNTLPEEDDSEITEAVR